MCRAEAKIQRPGKFDRRVRPVARVNHCDPTIARGGEIDRRVSRSRRGNEFEIGKALNDVAGQRRPLAHDANDVKRQQPLNDSVRIGEVVLKYGDRRLIAEHRPVGALEGHILVIVQNSDLILLHLASIPRGLIRRFASRDEGLVAKSSVCLSGFNVSLRAPFEC